MYRKILLIVLVLATITFPMAVLAEEQNGTTTLSLEQCLQMAYANSQLLKTESQNVAIAKEGVKEAEAGFLPTVDYQASYTRLDEAAPPQVPSENVFKGGISVTKPLYTGGKLTYALDIAKTKLNNAVEKERQVKQSLTYQVKEAYYNVWLTEEMVIVAKASYDNMGRHTEQMEKLFKVGTASKFEVLRAQVQQEGIKPQIIAAENGLSLAKLGLATLIGFDREKQFSVNYDIQSLKLPDHYDTVLTKLLNEAYENRSELLQLQLAAKMKNLSTTIVALGNKPNVGLTLSYDGQGDEINPGSWNKTLSLTLGVKGNIFDGTLKPKVESSKGEEELLKIQESSLKDKIRLEVQEALLNITKALETIKANQANINLSKESLRMTQARFDAGMATTMEIMDAQLALDKASNGYYEGISDYLTALAKLDLVVGK